MLGLIGVAGLCAAPLAVATSFPSRGGPGGCTGGGHDGCSIPVGARWDRWDMAGSTYAYCYAGCPLPWLLNHSTVRYGNASVSDFAGVVGVDHYWTSQGVPCDSVGEPHEFGMQEALAAEWKNTFPGLRFLSYRILSAVPYDVSVHQKIISHPEYFIRWRSEPDNATKTAQQCAADGIGACGVGDVCYNNLSPCFNDPARINAPSHGCGFQIKAAAYNWSNPDAVDWYVESVIMRALNQTDGVFLDGNGYDNGAWMCSGVCCGFGATNSPLTQPEIDQFCTLETAVATRAREQLIAHGGWDCANCFKFMVESLPLASDTPTQCAQKLVETAAWARNHSNYHAVVAYGYNTGAGGYNDSTADGAVAAFLLMRGQHWFFGIGVNAPCNPKHFPVKGRCHSDGCGKPCPPGSNSMDPATVGLIVSDYGRPLGEMEPVPAKPLLYQRRYERATVQLDCSSYTGHFIPV